MQSVLFIFPLPKYSEDMRANLSWRDKLSRSIFTTTVHCWDAKLHDDVIKWKYFPRYWPFVRGIHRPPVNSPHKVKWRGALVFSFISVWINGWENNREAGDLRRYRAHYVVIVMMREYHLSLRCTPTSGYARGTRIGTVFSGTWNLAEYKSIMVTMNATFRSICTSTDVYDLNLPKDH